VNERFGLLIDQERCIGCEACSIACRIENKTPYFWITIETQGGHNKDTPKGEYPNLSLNFLPKLCNHCEQPPCIDSCPVNAINKRKDGVVILFQDKCTGCQACLEACPYGVISFNDKNKVAEKCNFCSHRIDENLDPFCVTCCEGQAMVFGDLNDSNSKISKMIIERKAFQLNPEEGTNPSVYYSPPKPKKHLL
jgi:Fe-S-cluster-containing dehydrogenase component